MPESNLPSEERNTSSVLAAQQEARTPARKLSREDLSSTSALIRGCCSQGCCAASQLDETGN